MLAEVVELKKNQFFNDLGDKEEIRDRYAIRDKFLRPVKIIKWCAAQKVTNCMELEDKSRYRDQHMRMITDWMLWNQYKCINGGIKISGRNVQREKFKKVLWSSAYEYYCINRLWQLYTVFCRPFWFSQIWTLGPCNSNQHVVMKNTHCPAN